MPIEQLVTDHMEMWTGAVLNKKAAGRGGVFTDYRLRVASVLRDYGLSERREQAPRDSRDAHGQ